MLPSHKIRNEEWEASGGDFQPDVALPLNDPPVKDSKLEVEVRLNKSKRKKGK